MLFSNLFLSGSFVVGFFFVFATPIILVDHLFNTLYRNSDKLVGLGVLTCYIIDGYNIEVLLLYLENKSTDCSFG